MIIYIIIGVISAAYLSIQILISNKEDFEKLYYNPGFWIAMVTCGIFWPIIAMWLAIEFIQIKMESHRIES